jgi:hypothetical protein
MSLLTSGLPFDSTSEAIGRSIGVTGVLFIT